MSQEEHIKDVKDALKKAGRGGWRVDLEAICDIATKSIEKHQKKFSVTTEGGAVEIVRNTGDSEDE
jgi:beta-glucosidase/6-phospho-beta-glucosidase/beta-galactosidase